MRSNVFPGRRWENCDSEGQRAAGVPVATGEEFAGVVARVESLRGRMGESTRQVQAKIEKLVVYDPAATNPWCNTLLIPLGYYDYRLTIIPPGIGISYVLNPLDIQPNVKLNYLLLDQETYKALSDRINVELLDTLPIGDLYRNLDSGCNVRN